MKCTAREEGAMKRNGGFMLAALLLAGLSAGCTTIGIGTHAERGAPYSGKTEALRLCIYKDSNVSDASVNEIIGAVREEFSPFGLRIEVPWIRKWDRPAFEMEGILKDIAAKPLECPCDRLFAVVGRDGRDFVWGLMMPEVLGAVEDSTLTKGYAVGSVGSLNQVLSLQTPKDIAVHEAYHLLGCKHGLFADSCYRQVASIRRVAQYNREQGEDFFPAMSLSGRIFWTRAEVDKTLGINGASGKDTAKGGADPERIGVTCG
jgi:hypothetical protein